LLPYERTCQLVEDLFSRTISQGTLDNWIEECFSNLESTEAEISRRLYVFAHNNLRIILT
jgi:hypothetical protein